MLMVVLLICAGCSTTPAEPGSENTTAATHDKAVTFADCMRSNGVSEFPDPTASGDFAYGIEVGSPLDPSSAAWKKAISACKDLQPPGSSGGAASPQEMSRRLTFARCMRDNGVRDFPDPVKDGPLIDTNRIPSAAGKGARDIPGFDDAIQKCTEVYSGEPGDR